MTRRPAFLVSDAIRSSRANEQLSCGTTPALPAPAVFVCWGWRYPVCACFLKRSHRRGRRCHTVLDETAALPAFASHLNDLMAAGSSSLISNTVYNFVI